MSHPSAPSGRTPARAAQATHPTLYAPMSERIDYACVIAAFMACDGNLDPARTGRLRDLCREIGLPPHMNDKVVASLGDSREGLRERLYRLRDSQLKMLLVRDMVKLGFSKGRYEVTERREVRGLAALMLVGEDKVKRIEDEVVAELRPADLPEEEPEPEPEGSWAGVKRLYRRLLGTLVDAD